MNFNLSALYLMLASLMKGFRGISPSILHLQPSLRMAAGDEGERRRREVRGGDAAHPPAGDRPHGLAGRRGAAQQARLPRLPQEARTEHQMPREVQSQSVTVTVLAHPTPFVNKNPLLTVTKYCIQ